MIVSISMEIYTQPIGLVFVADKSCLPSITTTPSAQFKRSTTSALAILLKWRTRSKATGLAGKP
jgi:hypothetical protein